MGFKEVAWAMEQNFKGDLGLKFLLVALCEYCNPQQLCWPGQERLADTCECSIRTIRRRLEELEERGFISRRHRQRETTIYRINFRKKPLTGQNGRSKDLDRTDADRSNGGLDRPNPVLDRPTRCPTNHQLEPPIESKPIGLDSMAGGLFKNDELPKRQPKRSQRKMMPEDWQPDETGIIYARERGFVEEKIGQLVVACRDYHLKHGTLIAGSVGLAATWRTWINNEIKFSEERRKIRYAHRNEATDLDDRIRNLVDEARRLEDAAGVIRPSDAFRSH